MIQICTVGGYNEVGKNMTAIRIGDDVIIADMGVDMDKYIKVQEEREGLEKVSRKEMIHSGAVPDDSKINNWKHNVRAIVCTHAHLDHIAAIPYLASKYNCSILGTPFTIEIIKRICRDNKIRLPNHFKQLNVNDTYPISKDIKIKFINVTHSVVQTVLLGIEHKEGTVVYANDFKFDMSPTLGPKSDPEKLKKLNNVRCLIVDSVYSKKEGKMPSESVPRVMLQDILKGVYSQGNAIIVTTFASHLARLKSIIDFGKQLNRKIVFLGRSLHKYTDAAEKLKIVEFSKDGESYTFRNQVDKFLKELNKNRDKYLVVVTGHQGEPKAVLSRIVNGETPFNLIHNDIVIIASNVIPTRNNINARGVLDNKIRKNGVRLFTGIHSSGHCAKEDLRMLIETLQPEHIIPAHAPRDMQEGLFDLAKEMGYKEEKVHMMSNGDVLELG